jgi:hypothetical protein
MSGTARATGSIDRPAIRLFYGHAEAEGGTAARRRGGGKGRPGGSGDVARVFAKLPPRQRALLWLAYAEGCAHRGIGNEWAWGSLRVRVPLYPARQRLASIRREGGYEDETG